jgi:hypothetical protein
MATKPQVTRNTASKDTKRRVRDGKSNGDAAIDAVDTDSEDSPPSWTPVTGSRLLGHRRYCERQTCASASCRCQVVALPLRSPARTAPSRRCMPCCDRRCGWYVVPSPLVTELPMLLAPWLARARDGLPTIDCLAKREELGRVAGNKPTCQSCHGNDARVWGRPG